MGSLQPEPLDMNEQTVKKRRVGVASENGVQPAYAASPVAPLGEDVVRLLEQVSVWLEDTGLYTIPEDVLRSCGVVEKSSAVRKWKRLVRNGNYNEALTSVERLEGPTRDELQDIIFMIHSLLFYELMAANKKSALLYLRQTLFPLCEASRQHEQFKLLATELLQDAPTAEVIQAKRNDVADYVSKFDPTAGYGSLNELCKQAACFDLICSSAQIDFDVQGFPAIPANPKSCVLPVPLCRKIVSLSGNSYSRSLSLKNVTMSPSGKKWAIMRESALSLGRPKLNILEHSANGYALRPLRRLPPQQQAQGLARERLRNTAEALRFLEREREARVIREPMPHMRLRGPDRFRGRFTGDEHDPELDAEWRPERLEREPSPERETDLTVEHGETVLWYPDEHAVAIFSSGRDASARMSVFTLDTFELIEGLELYGPSRAAAWVSGDIIAVLDTRGDVSLYDLGRGNRVALRYMNDTRVPRRLSGSSGGSALFVTANSVVAISGETAVSYDVNELVTNRPWNSRSAEPATKTCKFVSFITHCSRQVPQHSLVAVILGKHVLALFDPEECRIVVSYALPDEISTAPALFGALGHLAAYAAGDSVCVCNLVTGDIVCRFSVPFVPFEIVPGPEPNVLLLYANRMDVVSCTFEMKGNCVPPPGLNLKSLLASFRCRLSAEVPRAHLFEGQEEVSDMNPIIERLEQRPDITRPHGMASSPRRYLQPRDLDGDYGREVYLRREPIPPDTFYGPGTPPRELPVTAILAPPMRVADDEVQERGMGMRVLDDRLRESAADRNYAARRLARLYSLRRAAEAEPPVVADDAPIMMYEEGSDEPFWFNP